MLKIVVDYMEQCSTIEIQKERGDDDAENLF